MRERLEHISAKQQWQAESLQGFQETILGVHTRHQAEARRHGKDTFLKDMDQRMIAAFSKSKATS